MGRDLIGIFKGLINLLLLTLMTFGITIWIFILGFIRIFSTQTFKNRLDSQLHNLPDLWSTGLKLLINTSIATRFELHGLKKLKPQGKYVMVANHQSWLDILILQSVFSGRIPGLRFFMKKQLMWQLPLIGLACKLLGYPFMQRYSSDYLEKHPHLRGKDLEETRQTCEKFKTHPITLINFLEGSRCTRAKRLKQKSPYRNLLKPRAGGLSFMLTAIGSKLDAILDVTILYSDKNASFWKFLCGKLQVVEVFVHAEPVTSEILGDYQNDADFRAFFQYWLNEKWAQKDNFITNTLRFNQANASKTSLPAEF